MDPYFIVALIRIFCMIFMFFLIIVTGLIPIKVNSFHSNEKLMSLSSAFSGGLFLSVALIHLLPEAIQTFQEYALSQEFDANKPYVQIISLASFLLFLYVGKIRFQEKIDQSAINLGPYILQIAIGIHALFEGIAIGIETHTPECLGIAVAVICHKWAEGLALGVAFKKAQINIEQSQKMIFIQALMNPLGIAIGWSLSGQSLFVTSTFKAISIGTFLYISLIEVIVEEFTIKKYQLQKFGMFIAGVAFISFIFFLEETLL